MEREGLEQLKNQTQEWLQQAEKMVRQLPQTRLYAAIGVVILTTFLLLFGNSRYSLAYDKLRASRAALSAADIADEYTLGIPGETFAFSQCRNKVTVEEASGLTGEVSQLQLFIRKHVKT